MTFVEPEQWLIALYDQNELHEVAIGNEAEVSLETYPGRIIKCEVDAIIWAQGQGQLPLTGTLPQTTVSQPDGKFPVKLKVADKDKDLFLAAGARGHTAIYTDHFAAIHLVRKVLMRFSAFLDWLVLKAH
jgi:multidrug resistance efflux pump